MGADKLAGLFETARGEGRAVFMPFLTAGIPTLEQGLETFVTLSDAGADAFEVGIPYSDPLMDGPVIQAASDMALANGVRFSDGLDLAGRVGQATSKPVIAMTYVNPILAMGPEAFARRAAEIGIDCVIVPDVPFEEAGTIKSPLAGHGVGMALFAAPTTSDERLIEVVKQEPTFIYGVADLGVTGERSEVSTHLEGLVRRVRALTQIPLVLGVGVSTPEQAAVAASLADGVIIGSALVKLVLAGEMEAFAGSAAAFAAAVHDYDGGRAGMAER